jgi:rod shape-determining protein MreB and related proteins
MSFLSSLIDLMLYIQISPERVTVRNPKTSEQVSEIPELAITDNPKFRVVGVGGEARSKLAQPNVRVVNPFAHPRSLVSDFTAAEQLIKAFMAKMLRQRLFSVSPKVVLHPLGDPAGGFTQVEIRAFQEMALGAGARAATVWQGRPLTDQELLLGQFPATGKVLN